MSPLSYESRIKRPSPVMNPGSTTGLYSSDQLHCFHRYLLVIDPSHDKIENVSLGYVNVSWYDGNGFEVPQRGVFNILVCHHRGL